MNKNVPIYDITAFSENEKDTWFYANELKAHLESHQFVNAPHRHSTYISILFTRGSGKHQIDFDTFPVKPGSIFLLSPGQVHCWTLSKDVEGFVFFHTKDFYDQIFLNRKIEDFPFFYLHQNYPVIYLSSEAVEKPENLFGGILQEFKNNLLYRKEKIGALVDLLYMELARVYDNKENRNSHRDSGYFKVKQLQKFIDEYFKVKKLPNEYADLMNMSTRHLSRICQKILNKTTHELIADRIIVEAKRMLINKDSNVSSVADALGYDDHSYFIRMFKKKVSLSPKEFKQKMSVPFS